jgi:hypothetical protein
MADPAVPREITDKDSITWSCIQTFAGLGNDPEKTDAARVNGSDRLRVLCTPSGGAASVRLELLDGWEAGMPDSDLLQKIRKQLGADQAQ